MIGINKRIQNIKNLIAPRAVNEDAQRREFIFNILIGGIVVLLCGAMISSVVTYLFLSNSLSRLNSAISLFVLLGELVFFVGLYAISRKGYPVVASYIFLGLLFLLGCYMWYRWGVDVVIGILDQALVIIMSGILIGSRFAFIATGSIAATMVTMGHFQQTSAMSVNHYWKVEPWRHTDTAIVTILFLIFATVSWLSNRESEKSLQRAKRSEADLKKERDSLEIVVEKRTKELQETQAERLAELYRFAEFGRISSGLFHDLMNPLNAVSLNIEKLRGQNDISARASLETAGYVERAVHAARRLEDLVIAVRKQLAREENSHSFSPLTEIDHAVKLLSHKAEHANVSIYVSHPGSLGKSGRKSSLFGDAVKFHQIILNLIDNAIESYVMPVMIREGGRVVVSLHENENHILLSVRDYGSGIIENHKDKIFEPFFTTKAGKGIGIGLSMTKRIIEKDFGGTIDVFISKEGGTLFTVQLPKHEKSPSAQSGDT